jgi:hypothetical protein
MPNVDCSYLEIYMLHKKGLHLNLTLWTYLIVIDRQAFEGCIG